MTIDMIKANNLLAGKFFFSAATMRFFKSRVFPTVYGNRYFITSEIGWDMVRRYSIREAINEGRHIKTVEYFAFMTLAAAKDEARAMVERDRGAASINKAVA